MELITNSNIYEMNKMEFPLKNPTQKPTEKGQSLVELGLSIMVLLLLFAGVVDLGSMFFNYMAMRDAAQEGASYASVFPTECSNTEARVRANLRNADAADVQVEILVNGKSCASATTADACAEKMIIVSVHQPNYELMMPFIGAVVGRQTIDLKASIHNTILRPVCD
jgi:Flp pilus assembly protein TadG